MTSSDGQADSAIDKRDFDANRPILQDGTGSDHGQQTPQHRHSRSGSYRSRLSRVSHEGSASDDGLLNDVVEGIVELDRRKMHREVVRAVSFAWGVVTWYENPLPRIMLGSFVANLVLLRNLAWVRVASLRSLFMVTCYLQDFIIHSSKSTQFLSQPRSQCTF